MVVKVLFAVVKQLKQLQRKPRKNSEAPTGSEPVNSVILVQFFTNGTDIIEILGSNPTEAPDFFLGFLCN